ncbi:hypothetical protein G4B88_010107 [Cannabis sativa]|uniref:Uncharacterized protein n=2 Tax=Cannabis sativa TaxID=3483 RepID=A0A7J6GJ27_CANSA|nr:hypothetical protein G4B88_010107 [Cannabis sativa]
MAKFILSYWFSLDKLIISVLLLLSVSGNGVFCSPMFIFGDSTVDPGNNNYIKTIAENQANYEPYAEYANLPIIPPFLQPSADYINGVNFASGGAGVLPETNQGLVIDLPTQLKSFEKVEKWLVEKLGEESAQKVITEAVYFISIGSNDYMAGYLGNPKTRELYNPEQYVGMVIGNLTQAVQVLYEKGGRKFGFLSLCPLGCLPIFRALSPKASEGQGVCLEEASALASAHNNALRSVLTSLEFLLKGFKYSNSNFYDWLYDRINHPTKHGFKDGVKACCGTGPYGGIYSCGGRKNITEYQLCPDVDDYVWWDSVHATQRIHQQLAMGPLPLSAHIISNTSSSTRPNSQ